MLLSPHVNQPVFNVSSTLHQWIMRMWKAIMMGIEQDAKYMMMNSISRLTNRLKSSLFSSTRVSQEPLI